MIAVPSGSNAGKPQKNLAYYPGPAETAHERNLLHALFRTFQMMPGSRELSFYVAGRRYSQLEQKPGQKLRGLMETREARFFTVGSFIGRSQ